MRIVTVVGARPQFVKAAPVSAALAQRGIEEVLVDTGQHYDPRLAGAVKDDVGLRPPDVELGVGSGTHAQQTAAMLLGIEPVVMDRRPDAVLVYGDTNSTLAGALVAAKLNVPLAHVEAGLRSFNRRMPEEVNRVTADHLSTWSFCTSPAAVANLAAEGVVEGVHVVGDVMFDAVTRFAPPAGSTLGLDRFGVTAGHYALATVHRAENTDDPARLAQVLSRLASWPDPVVLPVHPRLRDSLRRHGLELPGNVRSGEPTGYVETLSLVRSATHVLTDSGGLQKEALWLETPCITLRDETEWTETVECGWNHVVGVDEARFAAAARAPRPAGAPPSIYGDGRAAARIAALLAGQPLD